MGAISGNSSLISGSPPSSLVFGVYLSSFGVFSLGSPPFLTSLGFGADFSSFFNTFNVFSSLVPLLGAGFFTFEGFLTRAGGPVDFCSLNFRMASLTMDFLLVCATSCCKLVWSDSIAVACILLKVGFGCPTHLGLLLPRTSVFRNAFPATVNFSDNFS